MRRSPAAIALVLALALGVPLAHAQEEDAGESSETAGAPGEERAGLLRVFLDCPDGGCDEEYFRTEIAFVDFVRDREDAEVHVLMTTQVTGSGGTEFTLALIGRGRFVAVHDKLVWVAAAQATKDEIRRALVDTLELGLVRYAAHTAAAPRLHVSWEGEGPAARGADPWNAWTFRISTTSYFHGEQEVSDREASYAFSANRVVDRWKYSLGASGNYSESHYQLPGPPVTNYTSIARSYRGGGDVIRSLAPHWSARGYLVASSSTFVNEALAGSAACGIEYDVFPYDESTRRLLAFRYHVGEHYFKYGTETIYGYLDQYLPSQNVEAVVVSTQPWGEVSLDVAGSNFFLQDGSRLDLTKNRLSGYASVDLKIVKGLSLTLSLEGGLIHDQIFLSKQGATDAEVLLERRQLETSFNYVTSIGLAYTFGSIYSSVVNPRFGSTPFFN